MAIEHRKACDDDDDAVSHAHAKHHVARPRLSWLKRCMSCPPHHRVANRREHSPTQKQQQQLRFVRLADRFPSHPPHWRTNWFPTPDIYPEHYTTKQERNMHAVQHCSCGNPFSGRRPNAPSSPRWWTAAAEVARLGFRRPRSVSERQPPSFFCCVFPYGSETGNIRTANIKEARGEQTDSTGERECSGLP